MLPGDLAKWAAAGCCWQHECCNIPFAVMMLAVITCRIKWNQSPQAEIMNQLHV
jgi:hypothetical protein